ncbi:cytoplasmic dynein 1 heavy chain 1-like isoform X1 [Lingula anatina]|uniref:Cytoplasmic dynein 1 heavy chain 1-like isoform X1 n=1 Tax=Lingula anatina TaxID=7574 RepID=A0A1S3IWT8_LINAN|nr:cytoplasmic dynein 1 heavy chain 1-like isoform X1 [Lingula anatina]|eukprot:XP_013402014.1 cytoplasmic dynein 1 heavy chain 1-like isoform X1 [Lingula anatina]
MVKDQQEAERKKVTSQEIQAQLAAQTKVIQEKQKSVKEDLDKVEPAVIEAQQAVKSIKKQHLVEVRAMGSPPPILKMVLESICILLGESAPDWKSIRQMIIKDSFIQNIVSFQAENIPDDIRSKMKQKYLNNPDFTYDKVNRASLACGPMVKWVIAQINYADMIKRVEPLRNELKALEDEADINKHKNNEVNKLISNLEKSIAKYKEEYAVLISQAQAIKADLAAVETKVERSVALLKSLTSERERWEQGSEGFKAQMSTIIGDVLLSAAFLAYAGYFDQQMRHNLFTTWCHHLQQAHVQFRQDLARVEYLSSADERLRWQANALPADDLCVENAIMLGRFNRYPLIIDPSGQATEFIMNEYKEKKITKTSFLDDAFRKNLESALRFGNPLLVQDVENYDPILNPVLNRELRRTGGRILITLGDQDIDLSPSFTIFLSTRDPTVEFPPDICSRVTFVNFTVTRSSLQSQCLNQVLKAERPDIDAKRSDLLKLQGEFALRLRHLEKSLLQALNDVKGRILDDDSIISHLETLKNEAAEVQKKAEETDVVMAEVETVSQQYVPLAQSCSSIYFTLESLNQVHYLYQFSLHFFLDIFSAVLHDNSKLDSVKDYTKRLEVITNDLFQVTFNRVARGMLHHDQLVSGLLLARIHLKQLPSEPSYEAEFLHFMRGKEGLMTEGLPSVEGLQPDTVQAMVRLAKLPAFRGIMAKVNKNPDFFAWLKTVSPEHDVPVIWDEGTPLSSIGKALYQMLVIQTFRPDRLLAMGHTFVVTVMGNMFFHDIEQEVNLAAIVENEIRANTPILLCSVPGYDASGRVDDLAAELNKPVSSIAIGSAEGFDEAAKVINSASRAGKWVMLKNVHLAPGWLVQLEKKLHSLQPHPNFRLFLTMEINPKLPVNLLRAGRIFVFEPPPGVRANLLRTFSTVPSVRMGKAPSERARLYFLLAWFHAIVQERLTYVPLGWSKKYEFNESDLRCGCDTIDTWVDMVAMGRSNLPPEKIPWDALRILLSQCIYGGKIDNDFDQRLLNSFLNKLFTPKSFDADFPLVTAAEAGKAITMPDGIRREQFVQWSDNRTELQTPSWLGLPNNAEIVLLTNQGSDLVNKMLKMQLLEDDEELAYGGVEEKKKKEADGRPAWMRILHNSVVNWFKLVPKKLNILRRTAENIKDPLFRFFEREVNTGARLLQDMRRDMDDIMLICQGQKKPTNHHRSMMSDLPKGIIPLSWKRYTVPSGMTVIEWITDFSERIKQLQAISAASQSGGAMELKNFTVWLGGLFIPEAYITATRQYVAQANSWSLEELYLQVSVSNKGQDLKLDDCSFGVKGLKLQGALCENNKLKLSSTISTDLPFTALGWRRMESGKKPQGKVTLPVYLNSTRAQLLFTLDFDTQDTGSGRDHSFYERGVALVCSNL